MKYLIAIVFVCVLNMSAIAQNNAKAKKFISGIVNRGQVIIDNQAIPESGFVYQDSIDSFSISIMRKAFQHNKNDVFYKLSNDSITYIENSGKKTRITMEQAHKLKINEWSKTRTIYTDSLKLTKAEKDHINAEIDKMSHQKWDGNLLMNCRMISVDTVNKIFANRKDSGWEYLESKGIRSIYTIGMPIFLRNDTYCFFYCGYQCGGRFCGGGEFTLYKKESGIWYYWARVSFWIS